MKVPFKDTKVSVEKSKSDISEMLSETWFDSTGIFKIGKKNCVVADKGGVSFRFEVDTTKLQKTLLVALQCLRL